MHAGSGPPRVKHEWKGPLCPPLLVHRGLMQPISRCEVSARSAGLGRPDAHLGNLGEVQQPLALHQDAVLDQPKFAEDLAQGSQLAAVPPAGRHHRASVSPCQHVQMWQPRHVGHRFSPAGKPASAVGSRSRTTPHKRRTQSECSKRLELADGCSYAAEVRSLCRQGLCNEFPHPSRGPMAVSSVRARRSLCDAEAMNCSARQGPLEHHRPA